MRKRLLVALLVAAWMSCCASNAGEGKDRLAVQHTVLRYTQLLAQGYANMNMTNLQEVATKEQVMRAYNHMSALGEAKIRMESELVDIEFLDIQLHEKDLSRVKTREKWNYTHVNTDAKMPGQRSVTGLIYMLSYDLVRRNGTWLVSSVSTLEAHNMPAGSK